MFNVEKIHDDLYLISDKNSISEDIYTNFIFSSSKHLIFLHIISLKKLSIKNFFSFLKKYLTDEKKNFFFFNFLLNKRNL